MPRITTLVAAAGLVLGTLPLFSCGDDSGGTGATSGSAAAAANRDFASEAREVIRSNQIDPEAENSWPEFVRVCHMAEGAAMLLAEEEAVQAWFEKEEVEEKDRHGRAVLLAFARMSDEMGEPEREVVRSFLKRAEHAGFFEILDELAETECIVPPIVSPLHERRIPHVAGARVLTALCAARLVHAQSAGDDDEVVRSFKQLQAIERAAACESGFMPCLVGVAARGRAMRTVAAMVRAGEVSPELAARLGEVMDRHGPLPVEVAIETERLAILEFTGLTYDGLEEADGGRRAGDELWVPGLTPETRGAALKMINEYMDAMHDAMLGDAAKRESAIALMEQIREAGEADDAPPHAGLVYITLPPYRRLDGYLKQGDAETAGVRTMLAIVRFVAQHGAPPETLDDLVPEYLPAIPTDPYADGAPLRYRVPETTDGEDSFGYILYTVAADRQDDGGQIAPGDMRNAFIKAGRGYDFVFTNPQWE